MLQPLGTICLALFLILFGLSFFMPISPVLWSVLAIIAGVIILLNLVNWPAVK